MEEVARAVGFGPVGLHQKVMLPSGSLVSLRLGFPRRGTMAPSTKALRIHEIRKDT